MSRVRRRVRVALAGLVALALPVSGCSLLADRAPPEETLTLLADGLQRGDLGAVPLTAESRAEAQRLPQVLEQLDGLRPTVRATPSEQVDRGRTRTRAVLEYTWEPGADPTGPSPSAEGEPGPGASEPEIEPWTYARDVELVKSAENDWQVVWTPAALAPGLDPGEVLDSRRVPAERADVLGAGDEPLVRMREVERVGLDKTQVRPERQEDSARELAELLDIDADAFVERVEAAGDQAFVEALVVRGSETETLEEIRSEVGEIDGARLVPDERPLAPSREFAGPVLGVAGPATEEVVQASGGDLVAGDFAGLTGLQARYDDQLRGTPGTAIVTEPVDPADGAPDEDAEDEVLHTVPATDGTPLRLTLDERAQSVADSLLTEVETPAALVAVKPSTGEVLAAASGPEGGGFSNATEGLYPPGSTFKIVSALALLRSGVRPDDTVSCSREVTVDGRTFENYDDYPSSALGEISFEQAFANSCNTAFIRLWEQVGAEGLQSAAKSLGINTDADLGYPFTLGTVPDSDDPVEQAAMMIGQATVTTNALGVATVAASVAAGERVTPTLVLDGGDNPEQVQPLTEQEQADLQQLMRAVTTDGSGRFLGDLEGDPVLSKTGTAEYGGGEEPATHGWMVAVQGDLAVAVLVEDGESGSGSAGPVLEDFLRDWR